MSPKKKKTQEPTRGDLSSRLDPVREYCLGKAGSEEGFPFGPEVMVFKVAGKIFSLIAWEKDPLMISLKCDPDRAIELREEFESIIPGYHLNKKLWNSVMLDETISVELVNELIDQSYDLIIESLPKKLRALHYDGLQK